MCSLLCKYVSLPVLVIMLAISGCAGPLDLMIGAIAESQMTPEGLGISAANYRSYDCKFLTGNIKGFKEQMKKESDKRSWQWHIDAMNQVRAEKNCPPMDGLGVKAAGSSLTSAGEHVIGVVMEPVTPALASVLGMSSTAGVFIVEAIKNMPAERAGIKAKDVVLEVDGTAIGSPQELNKAVGRMQLETKAKVKVWRDGHRKTFMMEVASILNAPSSQVATALPPATSNSSAPPYVGPVFYAYCFYTDVALRKHWTSNVFEIVSDTEAPRKIATMRSDFYEFVSSNNKVSVDEKAFCKYFDTWSQADSEREKMPSLFRFNSVDYIEIFWKSRF